MKSVEVASIVNPPRIGTKALIGLAGLMAITFVGIAVLPYRAMFGAEDAARETLQGFQFAYWPRRGWLLIHIAGGLVALLSGPV